MTVNIEAILTALRHCLPEERKTIGLHEPYFGGNEWNYVKECIDTGWVSSVGQFVNRFEEQLAEYTGCRRAVAVVNGTAALHIALLLAGIQSDDEVLIPAMTFVATANAVVYCKAIPHFVDSEERTLGIDPFKLENYLREITIRKSEGTFNKLTGRRIKAIVPMHTFGHPVDLDPLMNLAEHYKLEVIEDAAESLGSLYKGRHTGNWGKISTLSFNGNKTITTGGGGAILTNDDKLGLLAKHITTTAKKPHQWDFYHDQIGFNYRMPNINAALGCAQLEQLESFIEKKRSLSVRYIEVFADIQGIKFFQEPEFARSNYWLNVLLLDKKHSNCRDLLLQETNAQGIMSRPVWTLMHKLPMFTTCPRMDLTVAEELESRIINIPSSVGL
jgi:perosamine synthetase